MTVSLAGPLPVFVVGLPRVLLAPSVEQDVGGPSIKTDQRTRLESSGLLILFGMLVRIHLQARWQAAEVADPAQVQNGHRDLVLGEQGVVKGGHQGGALAKSCNIAGAKIIGHINASELTQQRCIQELKRVAHSVVKTGLVAHSLSVRAQGDDVSGRERAGLQQGVDGLGIQARNLIGGQGAQVQLIVPRGVQGQELAFELNRVGHKMLGLRAKAIGKIDQDRVHTVHRRARHQSNEKARWLGGRPHGARARSKTTLNRCPRFQDRRFLAACCALARPGVQRRA